ncbi:MAG TPA: SDR family oxidoreductase, partial [Rhizobiales bacterium]|nr:SDR family oxidoreductase [Hyphomicrobiales bacterium]
MPTPENPQPRKTALITGASGGIGRAFAGLLAEEGHDLVLVARSSDELNRITGVEMARHPVSVTPLPLDLARHDAGDIIADELATRSISPDVLINNAGFGLNGPAASLPRTEQLALLDVNIRALSDLTLRFLPAMTERGAGGIINVSSVAAFLPGPHMAAYYASKAYVQTFSTSLSRELKGTGVTVTALCPGPVKTGFQARAGMDSTRLVYRLSRPQSAKAVALAGWTGFNEGKAVVYPRTSDMLMALAGKYLPAA